MFIIDHGKELPLVQPFYPILDARIYCVIPCVEMEIGTNCLSLLSSLCLACPPISLDCVSA